jgi:hypothetical protein
MKIGKAEVDEYGATMPKDATVRDFEQALQFAAWAIQGAPWWIGDLLNEAERRFGDGYAQSIPESLSLSKLNRLRSTSDRVAKASRKPNLGLSQAHYDTAARLPAQFQDEFLELAIQKGWGTNQFRDVVSEYLRISKNKYRSELTE